MDDVDRLTWNIIQGDALESIQRLKAAGTIVHSVVTSPPYFKKRQYGKSDKEIGIDGTVEEFVDNLADIFAAIPLHARGSIWVNLGDKRGKNGELLHVPQYFCQAMFRRKFSLIDDVIWAKVIDNDDGTTVGGCMTEPAPGRLNSNGFENLFRFVRLSPSQAAWSDTCAVRIPRAGIKPRPYLPPPFMTTATCIEGRNLHNVWRIPMGQTTKKHYAIYPLSLCERPIAMTCPMWVNPDGTLRQRIVEMEAYNEQRGSKRIFGKYNSIKTQQDVDDSGRMDSGREYIARRPVTKGWTKLDAGWSPGIVLDPFCGTGTTGEVALKMGRSFIGIDLYKNFCDLSRNCCEETMEFLVGCQQGPFQLIVE